MCLSNLFSVFSILFQPIWGTLNVIDLLLNEQKIFYPVGYIDIKRGPKILNIPYLGKYNKFLKLIESSNVLKLITLVKFSKLNELNVLFIDPVAKISLS